MKKTIVFLLLHFFILSAFTQTDKKEIASQKAQEAIKIMDEGRIDESIILLKEAEKLDPKNYVFPYEIAYALVMKKEYAKAIKLLKKVKKYKPTSSQVYQMSGNCYSFMGKPEKAIKEYEEGMKHFPNAGNLYLERGNIYLQQENYLEAVQNYDHGIAVDPEFPSNYFRLAKLFLNSNDKLSGLIYGEIFMNLERSTERTLEMSRLLFDTYKKSITIGEGEIEIDFCEIIIDATELDFDDDNLKLPFCGIFGKNFILAVVDEKEINLSSLSSIRKKFLENYFKEDYLKYPNVLFEYHKKIMDNYLFDAYNHYLFQIGAEDQFETWLQINGPDYDRFVDWFTAEENYLKVTSESRYTR